MTQRDVSGNARGQYEHADLVRIIENEDALGRWLMLGIAAAMQQLNLRARRHAPLSEVCKTSPRGFLECDPNHLALMVAQIAEAEDLPLTLIGDNERNRLFIVNLNENRARDSSDSCTLYNFPDRPNQGTGLRPIFQEDQGRVIGETVSLSALYGSDNNRARFEPAPRDSEQFVTWATKFLEGPRHRTDLIAKQGSGTQPDHFKE
jgi:hypothetical protein